MYFFAGDTPQSYIGIDTPPMITWVGEPVTLEATIVDDGVSDVTVTWSTDEADPNETWTDQVTVIPAGATYPVTVSATVAIDTPAGEVVVTATAADSTLGGTVTDSVSIYVFENQCLATQELAGMPPADVPYDHPGDINQDCVIDLEDLAILASYWTVDYSLSGPTAIIP